MDRRFGRLHYLFKDLTGQRFGKLLVLGLSEERPKGHLSWDCLCDCGTRKLYRTAFLTRKMAVSCGCHGRRAGIEACTRHGKTKTPEYRIWTQIIQRCHNEGNPNFKNYGGRGIYVCQRWRDDFLNFLTDMGVRPSEDYTIDRIDNDGPYSPENCQWATKKQQCRNRRSSRTLTFNGETKTVAEWADVTGIHSRTIRARLDKRGWSIERALTEPVA